MQRLNRRPDWGWETPWDVYNEMFKILPTGELTLTQTTDSSECTYYEFRWYVSGRYPFAATLRLYPEQLIRIAAREIARRWITESRKLFEEKIALEVTRPK